MDMASSLIRETSTVTTSSPENATERLHTLSLNLYGNRDYALQYIEEDDAVNLRCQSGRHPFFDESKLADRARSVLKSLKIDAKQFDILGRHGITWATSESWPSRAAK